MGKRNISRLMGGWIKRLEGKSPAEIAALKRQLAEDVCMTPENESLVAAIRVIENRARIERDMPERQRRRRPRASFSP